MEYKVEGSVRNRKFIEAILPSMFKQLGLENSRKAVVIRVADECGEDKGITVDLSKLTGCYMVVIKPPAGTAAVNTAPFEFTAGTNLTTPEAGALEYDGTYFYLYQDL